ncbi:MAG: hypothetical protein E7445_06775 [Ruminococcaceae bacterium]|nr:hypothetical protein [Oscillospiraceae bacterium]
MKKIKEIFLSEKGMEIVNAIFFLSIIFSRSGLSGFLFIAYIVWIAYLLFCIKHTSSKDRKVIYSGIAVIIICLNLYFLLRG